MSIVHTYVWLCIMHQTLPNRNVYSIYQTDRDDHKAPCAEGISAIVLVTGCMPSPMLAAPPLEHSFQHYLYPGMDCCYQTGNPLAYRGMRMAAEVMLVMTALKLTLPL